MMTHDHDVPRPRQRDVLDRLLREHGLRRYGLFFVTGEGEMLPNQIEAMSGYAVDEQGQAYFFWLGWDATWQRPIFTEWKRVASDPKWERSAEYQRARAAAVGAA